MQGSTHFSRTQALVLEQSSFIVHSGEQRGGTPKYPGLQLHEADPWTSWQYEYIPQGFGEHGFEAIWVIFFSLVHLINGSPS